MECFELFELVIEIHSYQGGQGHWFANSITISSCFSAQKSFTDVTR